MSGRVGVVLAEEAHIVNILPPKDIDTGAANNSDVFSMANHAHVSIIVTFGATHATQGNVTVEACDDFVPTNTETIPFDVYKEETAAGDTLGARTATAAAGFAVSAADNTTYVIEVDASELPSGKPNLRIAIADPGGATLASAVAVLSGARYAKEQSATAIA